MTEQLSKQEKKKIYNQRYINKHKDDPSMVCDVCNGKYTYVNKWHHLASKKHKDALIIIERVLKQKE
jgi:hypothetical protein